MIFQIKILIDYKTKEGKLFWSLPKRPPVHLDFDINDEFIYAIGSSQKVIYKFENREGYKNISRIHVSINVKDIFDYSGQIFMIGNSIDPQTGSSKLFLQRLIL